MELNLSWVTPLLAVGGSFPPSACPLLSRGLSVRHVVDVRHECCDDEALLSAHGIELLHLPTIDMTALSQEMLDTGVAWIGPRVDRQEKVLIHCEHGIGRSPLLTLCVLVSRGLTPMEALLTTKTARERVSPSPTQLWAYIEWCTRFRSSAGARWPVPSLEALMTVAYRHLCPSPRR